MFKQPSLAIAMLITLGAAANAACPGSPISNGTTADATQVMTWFDCKAPLDSPQFTGNVGIGAAPAYPLTIPFVPGTRAQIGNAYVMSSLNQNDYSFGTATWAPYSWTARSTAPAFFYGNDVGLYLFGDSGQTPGAVYTPTARMFIDSSNGNVGIGTVSPATYLAGTTGVAISGGYPGLAFNASGVGKTWLTYVQSTDSSFRLFENGVGPKIVVMPGGNVGIGTAGPTEALEVGGRIKVNTLASTSSTGLCINANVLSSCSSSIRYKEDVQNATFGLREVGLMRPVTFKWKGRAERDFGLIAEEVAAINPLFVTRKAGKIEGVKYPQLVAVLIGAIKQQQKAIGALAEQNRALRFRLDRMEQRSNLRAAEGRASVNRLTKQVESEKGLPK